MIPFPLLAEVRLVEVVGGLRALLGRCANMIWNRAGGDRLSGQCAILSIADDRPVILPADRLEVNNAAVRAIGLEVHEPALPIRRFHVPSLVRSIDPG